MAATVASLDAAWEDCQYLPRSVRALTCGASAPHRSRAPPPETPHVRHLSLLLAAALLAATAVHADSKPACDRACLTRFVDTYFSALAANTPASVPLAPNAKITTNGRTMPLRDAFWDGAERTVFRFDIVNERLGDTGTEAVVLNADGSKTMYMLRLKVADGKITEVETIKANKGEADRLWDPDTLKDVPPAFTLSIRTAEQDSYYGLI